MSQTHSQPCNPFFVSGVKNNIDTIQTEATSTKVVERVNHIQLKVKMAAIIHFLLLCDIFIKKQHLFGIYF